MLFFQLLNPTIFVDSWIINEFYIWSFSKCVCACMYVYMVFKQHLRCEQKRRQTRVRCLVFARDTFEFKWNADAKKDTNNIVFKTTWKNITSKWILQELKKQRSTHIIRKKVVLKPVEENCLVLRETGIMITVAYSIVVTIIFGYEFFFFGHLTRRPFEEPGKLKSFSTVVCTAVNTDMSLLCFKRLQKR